MARLAHSYIHINGIKETESKIIHSIGERTVCLVVERLLMQYYMMRLQYFVLL